MRFTMRWTLILLLLAGCNTAQRTGHDDPAIFNELKCKSECLSMVDLYGNEMDSHESPLATYVSRIFSRLVKVGESPDTPLQLYVLNRNIPNFLLTEGGELGLSRGLLDQLDNEAELAALLALMMSAQPDTDPSGTFSEYELEGAYKWVKLAGYNPQAFASLNRKLSSLSLKKCRSEKLMQLVTKGPSEGYTGDRPYREALLQ